MNRRKKKKNKKPMMNFWKSDNKTKNFIRNQNN